MVMLTEVVSVHGVPHEPSSLTACRQWHSAQKQAGEIPFKSENEGLMFYQLSKRCMIKHCSSRSSLQNK